MQVLITIRHPLLPNPILVLEGLDGLKYIGITDSLDNIINNVIEEDDLLTKFDIGKVEYKDLIEIVLKFIYNNYKEIVNSSTTVEMKFTDIYKNKYKPLEDFKSTERKNKEVIGPEPFKYLHPMFQLLDFNNLKVNIYIPNPLILMLNKWAVD